MAHLAFVLALVLLAASVAVVAAQQQRRQQQPALELLSPRLLRGGDFTSKHTDMSRWFAHEELDDIRDFEAPVRDAGDAGGGLACRVRGRGAPCGLVRPVSTSHDLGLRAKDAQFLLLRFEYAARGALTAGRLLVYVSIRHADGTLLPVTVAVDVSADKGLLSGEIRRACRWIPVPKPVSTILVAFGAVRLAGEDDAAAVVMRAVRLGAYRSQRTAGTPSGHLDIKKPREELASPEMRRLCPNVVDRRPERFHVEPDALVAERTPLTEDVTITTRLTMDRITRLSAIVRRYRGPVSASVFVRSRQDYAALRLYWLNDALLRRHATIHVIHDTRVDDSAMRGRSENAREMDDFERDVAFPVNFGRNVARKHSRTDYVLYLDADFIVTSNLRDDISNGRIANILGRLDPRQRAVVILPTYWGETWSAELPSTRSQLMPLLKAKRDDVVHRCMYRSSRDLDYPRWERDEDEANPVAEFFELPRRMLTFEPYYIGPRSMPLFSERYVGGGRDKMQRMHTTHMAGFKKFIWRKHFIVHVPHPAKNLEMAHNSGGKSRELHEFHVGAHHIMTFKEYYLFGVMDFEDLKPGGSSGNTALHASPNTVHRRWLLRRLSSAQRKPRRIPLQQIAHTNGVAMPTIAVDWRHPPPPRVGQLRDAVAVASVVLAALCAAKLYLCLRSRQSLKYP